MTVFPGENDNTGEDWKNKLDEVVDLSPFGISSLFDKHNTEFLCFDKIKKPLHRLHDICGLLYLTEIDKKSKYKILDHADYEMIDLCTDTEVIEKLTEEQVIYLLRCGISYSKEKKCLYMHT